MTNNEPQNTTGNYKLDNTNELKTGGELMGSERGNILVWFLVGFVLLDI
jgi:hypothetical protein